MDKLSSSVDCAQVAEAAVRRHLATNPLDHYAGIVTLHGLLRLAGASSSKRLAKEAKALLKPFYSGEIKKVGGVYSKMYCCGGNATGWLALAFGDKDALESSVSHAEELIASHPRDKDGIFGKLQNPSQIWIDSAFAVCPFLVFAGKASGKVEFYDEACKQIFGMDAKLLDKSNGLYHQSLNFAGPDKLSADHWSRGNGWGAIALAEMAAELPESYAGAAKARELFVRLMEACVKVQDADGLWHQEMSDETSYVETSGTGLILYSMGRGLEKGILPKSFMDNFKRGLNGYLRYISFDGSVFNTCVGCLCPGDGSIEAYKAHPWKLNDIHSFGPVALAFAQAITLGIKKIQI